MLFFRLCGYCIVLTRMKVMSLSVSSSFPKKCCQCNSFEKFKGRQIILEPCMKLKIASDVCYNDTKHYQVGSVKKQGRCDKLSIFKAGSFFLVSPSRKLSVTFDIQIHSNWKHLQPWKLIQKHIENLVKHTKWRFFQK